MQTDLVSGKHEISSLDQLKALASRLAGDLIVGDIILLSGDLGAGKTTFTQFLGEALCVEDAITSPTYTIVSEYVVKNHADIKVLIHIDVYRMQDSASVNTEYIQEIMQTAKDRGAVVVVEWGELLQYRSHNRTWHVRMQARGKEHERVVEVVHL